MYRYYLDEGYNIMPLEKTTKVSENTFSTYMSALNTGNIIILINTYKIYYNTFFILLNTIPWYPIN